MILENKPIDATKALTLLWAGAEGKRHVLQCDFPDEMKEFLKDKEVTEVGELVFCNQPTGCRSIEQVFKLLNG